MKKSVENVTKNQCIMLGAPGCGLTYAAKEQVVSTCSENPNAKFVIIDTEGDFNSLSQNDSDIEVKYFKLGPGDTLMDNMSSIKIENLRDYLSDKQITIYDVSAFPDDSQKCYAVMLLLQLVNCDIEFQTTRKADVYVLINECRCLFVNSCVDDMVEKLFKDYSSLGISLTIKSQFTEDLLNNSVFCKLLKNTGSIQVFQHSKFLAEKLKSVLSLSQEDIEDIVKYEKHQKMNLKR